MCVARQALKCVVYGTSLAVQGLALCASTAGGMGLISGGGIEILHAEWVGYSKEVRLPSG